jgi:putative DNA primase/helicase
LRRCISCSGRAERHGVADDDVDAAVRAFRERAASSWHRHPGDLEDLAGDLWVDPDNPLNPALDAAYRSGIVPPAERWQSAFILPIGRPVETALGYAGSGWPVFPCHWQGERRKRPLVEKGWQAATTDEGQIRAWWTRWPQALIGMPTGKASGLNVLDIDCKDPAANGYDTLAQLGLSSLPETPRARSASGGGHVYFATIDTEIRNSIAALGPGLDVRGDGGYIILPSPGSGYSWDPVWNFDTVAPLPSPVWLGHRAKKATDRWRSARERFDPQQALDDACSNIRTAGAGEKYRTVRRELFIVACLVRDRLLPEKDARHATDAALKALEPQADDPGHMWKAADDAWNEGLTAPSARRGRR